jgi:phosphate starvation-inducible membrane PsiE
MFGRALLRAIILGCAIGFCGNAAAAVEFSKACDLFRDAALGNARPYYNRTRVEAVKAVAQGAALSSIYFSIEVVLLLVLVVALFVVGALSSLRLNAALKQAGGENTSMVMVPDARSRQRLQKIVGIGKRLLRQILVTVCVVFVSFLLRSVYSVMFALANALQNSQLHCSQYVGRCSPCYNSFLHMQVWMLHTPGFQLMVALVSKPISLLVALWGMTSGHTLAVLTAKDESTPEVNSDVYVSQAIL